MKKLSSKCEICEKETPLQEHHITSKCYGGSNSPQNKTNICGTCHTSVHYGLIILEGKFSSSNGDILVWRNLGEESITGFPDPKVYIIPNTEYLRENYLKRYKQWRDHFFITDQSVKL